MKERNYGIDLLRLCSMFMVAVLHVLLLSGSLALDSPHYSMAWLLEVMAYCAVDCYGLISGYVGYREEAAPISYRRFPGLWLQIFTYSFGITLVGFLVRPEVIGPGSLFKAALPVTTSQYWFVSAYVGLFFLMPWLNRLLGALSQREADRLAGTLFGVYVVYATVAGYFSDPFKLQTGYSFVWLMLLYLLGGWMKKREIPQRVKPGWIGLCMAGCVLLGWLAKVLRPGSDLAEALVRYTSLPIVLLAFSLVALFARLKLGSGAKKWVGAFAPAAFGVYLIHVHPVIWNQVLARRLGWVSQLEGWRFPLGVLGCGFGIFAVCLLVEKLRLLLFRWLRIDRAVAKLTEKLEKRFFSET